MTEQLHWHEAVGRLRSRVSPQNYDMWLRPIELMSWDGSTIRLRAPNSYIRFWFESNFLGSLVKELRATQEAHRALVAEERETARLHDRLRYEIGEIEAAALRAGEEDALVIERTRLQHAEHLRESALVALTGTRCESRASIRALPLRARAIGCPRRAR